MWVSLFILIMAAIGAAAVVFMLRSLMDVSMSNLDDEETLSRRRIQSELRDIETHRPDHIIKTGAEIYVQYKKDSPS